MNKGESAELFLKAILLRLKDNDGSHPVLGKIIRLSDDRNLESLKWKPKCQKFFDAQEFEKLRDCLGLKKSSSQSKADITINGINYSVKLQDERPSIINHTTRPGFERICDSLGIKIDTLDKIIAAYWKKRSDGTITEDIVNSNIDSPFLSHKEYFRPIINYFVFVGSGSRDSKYVAERVLVMDYKSMQNGIRIIDKNQYYDEVWPNLRFSLRGGGPSKRGMPKNYPNCKNSTSIGKWTNKTQEGYKGALSVRVD